MMNRKEEVEKKLTDKFNTMINSCKSYDSVDRLDVTSGNHIDEVTSSPTPKSSSMDKSDKLNTIVDSVDMLDITSGNHIDEKLHNTPYMDKSDKLNEKRINKKCILF